MSYWSFRGGLRATLASRRPESGLAAVAYVALYVVELGVVCRLKCTRELARRLAQDAAIHLHAALLRPEPGSTCRTARRG